MAKKYFWLKLKTDFFTSRAMKKLRRIAGGDTYTIIYLKLQLLSLKDEGLLYYEGVEPTFYEEMALALDEDEENVRATLIFLENMGLIEKKNDHEYILTEVPYLIGSETDKAELMRKKRAKEKETPKLEIKTNAERQKAFRAKKYCEEKQHIPLIEDYANKTRYNGNYYIVFKRDACKCRICGSIENLCVHHIDGYDENKPQNSNTNKMITLCRECHAKVHRQDGFNISEDILESIDYYESNVTGIVTDALPPVTKRYTEIDIEKDIDIDKEKDIEIEKSKSEKSKAKRFTPPTLEEVTAYCIERGNSVDAQHFIDYYTSNGWLVGKNKMKDWKAAVRTWERNGYSTNKSNNSYKPSTKAQELNDFYNVVSSWADSEE